MIHITIYKRHNMFVGFEAKGHAEYAQSGSDIVCAAVSTLTQTVLMGIIDVVGAEVDYSIVESGALFCMSHDCDNVHALSISLLIEVMYHGLRDIEKNYSKFLGISEREVTQHV